MKMNSTNRRYRRYKWSFQKFIFNLLILAAIISIGTFCFSMAVNATQAKRIRTITVKPGDNLWTIAANIAPNEDPRSTIAKIKALNNLNDSDLEVGRNLKVEIKD